MATTDTERYVRVTLLTFEGGIWISKKILFRELDRSPGSPTIDTMLRRQRPKLIQMQIHGGITKKQLNLLFQTSGADTDVDAWDLSLLVKVVMFLFESSLSRNDISDLKEILRIRNDVVCHARNPSLEELTFNTYWTQLAISMSKLASAFDAEDNNICADIIRKLSRGPLDLQSSMDNLAHLCRNDELMDHILACFGRIERKQNDVASGVTSANNKLDDLIARMIKLQMLQEHGQCKAEIPMLNSNVVLSGLAEDDVNLAEEIVLKVIRSAISKADDPSDNVHVRNAVKQLLDELSSKGAVAQSAERGSIILILECSNLHGLANMLSLLRKDDNRHRLVGIENALRDVYEVNLEVCLVLPDATIKTLSTWADECLSLSHIRSTGDLPYERGLNLGIKCNSIKSTIEVINYFKSGDAANRLNQLSDALSEALNDKHIRVDAALDLEGFSDAIDGQLTLGLVKEDLNNESRNPNLSQRRPLMPLVRRCSDEPFDSISTEKVGQAQARPKSSPYHKQVEDRYTMPHSVSVASGTEDAFKRQENMSDNIGCALIRTRLQTITILYELADEIDQISKHSKIALLTGTSASILGAIVGVPLGIVAIVVTGGVAAVPIGIAAGIFGGIGAAGGMTSLGAGLGGHPRIKAKHKQAVDAIEADMDLGQQFREYIKKTKGEQQLLVGSKVSKETLAVGGVASLHAILLPLDSIILVKNSKDIDYETRHEKAEEIRGWAKNLETSLPTLRNFVEKSMN